MRKRVFNVSDAHRTIENLTDAQARQWATYANAEYAKLIAKDAKPSMATHRAVEVASKKLMTKVFSVGPQ